MGNAQSEALPQAAMRDEMLHAISSDSVEWVGKILLHHPELLNERLDKESGENSFHMAIRKGSREVLYHLLCYATISR